MYTSWIKDQEDDYNKWKDFSIFLGSFTNPEAAKKMLNTNSIDISDEQFNENTKKLFEQENTSENNSLSLHRRVRRKRKLITN